MSDIDVAVVIVTYRTADLTIDCLVVLLAHGFGSLKRIAQWRTDRGVPHFLVDLAQLKCFVPRS